MNRLISCIAIILSTFIVGSSLSLAAESNTGLDYVETADGVRASDTRELVQWTHTRLVFTKDLDRVAVGLSDILEVEVLGSKEVLVLAKSVGRTSLIVWYPDQTTETFLFGVNTDLSVLRDALSDIHANLKIELAPDRAALVLRGVVPTVDYRIAAEAAARNYLNAGMQTAIAGSSNDQTSNSGVLGTLTNLGLTGNINNVTSTGTTAIINLIQVEELPLKSADKIQEAIQSIGGADVSVIRMRHGDVDDDEVDSLLLSGTVRTQVELVRVLNVASSLFVGTGQGNDSANVIEAIANESGALIGSDSGQPLNAGIPGIGNGGNSGLNNEISNNVGRAKLLSVANGRILSTIEVLDLPQVRVSVQMYEVSRNRMKNWRPDMTLVTNDYQSNSFSNSGSGLVVQPDASARIGANGSQVENALQIIGGTLSNNFQVGTGSAAFDLLFSMMENEGISRTLSKPTLTVLAGEPAVFQVGGEVPVPSAFAPTGIASGDNVGSNTSGVFSGTEFRAFGIQLMVRPMVGEDDRITIDVKPTISMPDTSLTQSIAASTGTGLNTTAFNTRSLDTTTRLRDGQPLVIGGLVSRDMSENQAYTPGLQNLPVLGKLSKSDGESDSDRELIIIITPTIIREASVNSELWEFPGANELLRSGASLREYMR